MMHLGKAAEFTSLERLRLLVLYLPMKDVNKEYSWLKAEWVSDDTDEVRWLIRGLTRGI
jgi:hypothetical protein